MAHVTFKSPDDGDSLEGADLADENYFCKLESDLDDYYDGIDAWDEIQREKNLLETASICPVCNEGRAHYDGFRSVGICDKCGTEQEVCTSDNGPIYFESVYKALTGTPEQ